MGKEDRKLMKGSYQKVARIHGIAARQVGRAYRNVVDAIKTYRAANGNVPLMLLPDSLFESKRSNCARPLKYDRKQLATTLRSIPMKDRKTFRLMKAATGVEYLLHSWRFFPTLSTKILIMKYEEVV